MQQEGVLARELHQVGVRGSIQGQSQQDQASLLLNFSQDVQAGEVKILLGGDDPLSMGKVLQGKTISF